MAPLEEEKRPPFDLNSFIEQRQQQFTKKLFRYYANDEFVVDKIYKFEVMDKALKELAKNFL